MSSASPSKGDLHHQTLSGDPMHLSKMRKFDQSDSSFGIIKTTIVTIINIIFIS
jgi:hypothetical protein